MSNQLPYAPDEDVPPQTPFLHASPPQQAPGLPAQLFSAGMQATQWFPLQIPLQQSAPMAQVTSGEHSVLPSHLQELHFPPRQTEPEQQSAFAAQPGTPGSRHATQKRICCSPWTGGLSWQSWLQQFALDWHSTLFDRQPSEYATPARESARNRIRNKCLGAAAPPMQKRRW